jgi:RNA polymerase sigma-70 factor (ECF subfamily)
MFNVSDPEPPAADDGADDSLIVRAARSDPAAFAPLYRRYVTRVYRYIYSRVGNNADAEDLTAQVFLAALEGLQRYHEQGNFAA